MIDLTPLDVRKKKHDFGKAVRGYDTGEVDTFLDLVADRLEELVRQEQTLRERTESLREQVSHYKDRENALNEALLAAQELREEARSQAERDAAVRLREAETHAEAILLEADQAIRRSQRRLQEIQSHREHFLRQLRGLLQRFADNLEVEESRLRAEPDELGDLLDKLERDTGPFTPAREGRFASSSGDLLREPSPREPAPREPAHDEARDVADGDRAHEGGREGGAEGEREEEREGEREGADGERLREEGRVEAEEEAEGEAEEEADEEAEEAEGGGIEADRPAARSTAGEAPETGDVPPPEGASREPGAGGAPPGEMGSDGPEPPPPPAEERTDESIGVTPRRGEEA